MILNNTGFRCPPSRLLGQPLRLASKDLLPRAKIEPTVRDGNDNLAAHHAQHTVALRFKWASALFLRSAQDTPGPSGCASTGRSVRVEPVLRATPRSRGAGRFHRRS